MVYISVEAAKYQIFGFSFIEIVFDLFLVLKFLSDSIIVVAKWVKLFKSCFKSTNTMFISGTLL